MIKYIIPFCIAVIFISIPGCGNHKSYDITVSKQVEVNGSDTIIYYSVTKSDSDGNTLDLMDLTKEQADSVILTLNNK